MFATPLPATAAWRHQEARDGFEVVVLQRIGTTMRLRGCTAAVQDERAWSVRYDIEVDRGWHTVRARAWSLTSAGEREVLVERDGSGRWSVDGSERPELDGCLDVDLESSACTNTLPIQRMRLGVGQGAEAPAAYVRVLDLAVERLEQRYVRVGDDGPRPRYDYSAPAFGVECRLVFDEAGLVLEYPGIASRAA